MLHVSVLLAGFHQAYKHKSETQNYINLRSLKFYSLVFSFFSLSGKGLFSCIRHTLKYLCKIGCIRKDVPLVKIFNVSAVRCCGPTWKSSNITCLMFGLYSLL